MIKLVSGSSTLLALAISSALTFSSVANAADEHNVSPGLTTMNAPLGLHGVDPVSAIELGNAFEGSAKFAATHDGVAYYFKSKNSLDKFNASPKEFIPQNGGFCTYGVAVGKKFDGDPNFASVVDGKLYVFLNEDIYKLYLKDKSGTIAKANKQWKRIRSVSATNL